MPRVLAHSEPLRTGPSDEAEVISELGAGEAFEMLDNSVGWAWGYGGHERRVGYIKAEAVE